MLPPEFVDMLCCPSSRQDLRLASEEEVARLNETIRSGGLRNLADEVVDTPVNGALVRADEEVVYLIRQDIPILIADQAVSFATTLGDQRYQPAESSTAQS